MGRERETELYPPVKAFLEGLGYEVKGEIGAADVVAMRGDEPPLIVELKTGFSLILLQQAIARQAVTDTVYVAVPRWSGRAGWRAFRGNLGLCRRLGLGVMTVAACGTVEVHADPAPFQPRKSPRKLARLRAEFARREGDTTEGGTRGQVMTAYRQDAIRVAGYVAEAGEAQGAQIVREIGVARATAIMADNHYGWFVRVRRGIYTLTEEGRAAITERREDG
ncbi:hypothetical protein K1T73_13950 [Roseovarius sp. SCSIO 43702]|uniref:DUF2161 domain-containing phosphodiesterase n=1 Tax=Roseovarius sp. SCSIO 43702 TaxID=2823043 RepID=UPI001C737616|nr:DUF2161 family putative PD-(D/E)XK-type phosphodiesterase [Roseovarius sp. SCSIO 43702]QYX56154.1 hypothetical protein K1T73_13950 [Roseovarius sp. SCSIO 43702]